MAFVKGKSGNPGGRPTVVTEDGKTLRQLARGYTLEALETIVEILRDAEAPQSARISAAQMIHDRGWGKPVQAIVGDDESDPIQLAIQRIELVAKAVG